MKSLHNKLKSRAGETIAEVLIALLISSLALMMLAGMISAAGRAVDKSRRTLETYYSESPSSASSVSVTVTNKEMGTSYEPTVTPVERSLGGVKIISYEGGSANASS